MIKLETSLWYTGILMRGLASWPLSWRDTKFERALNFVHFAVIMVGMVLMFFQIFIFVVGSARDSREMTEAVCTQVLFLHTIVKVGMVRIHRDKFNRLIKSVRNSFENGSEELTACLHRYARVGNGVYGTYTMSVFLISMDYFVSPYFESSNALPLSAWYPFDYENSAVLYALAYSHQVILITLCGLTTGVDVTFGVTVFYCCARLEILQQNLSGLAERIEKSGRHSIRGEIDKKLHDCVEAHSDILRFTDDINDIYTYIVLVLFFSVIVTICCAGMQITDTSSEQSLNTLLVFSLLAGCGVMQLLFYYLPGNILVDEANAVGASAYRCGWESMPAKQRRNILLILKRSGRSPNLKVGRVSPLLLENYTKFLTTTASYFTSLQSIAGPV